MNKDQALQYITNAMNLREPQKKSLNLFAEYLVSEAGKKVLLRLNRENRANLREIETATKDYAQTIPETRQFQAFERTFPAYTFALATGVGKTRLMGAFVAYLHLVYGIRNFMLVAPGNTIRLSRYATEASILEERLQGSEEKDLFGNIQQGQREKELTRVSSLGEGRKQSPENTIIAALWDYPLVDYESEQKGLLLKLAGQAVAYYKSFVSDERTVKMMVENNFRQMAKEIYDQILEHKSYVSEGYLESSIREPKSYLEQYNISLSLNEKPVTLESQLDRFPREKVYTGFKKACHSMYRFDSSFEGRLAYLLDEDLSVEDWLRPAPTQFEGLYWRDESGDSQNRYEPDFVVEFEKEIVMIEVKPDEEIEAYDVQEKKKTAEKYCELVSRHIGNYGIVKPWRYVIVPTEKISLTATIAGLLVN